MSWATPYALSIMGNPQYQNCPFGNGNGYGDGRAISVGEVVVQGKVRQNRHFRSEVRGTRHVLNRSVTLLYVWMVVGSVTKTDPLRLTCSHSA